MQAFQQRIAPAKCCKHLGESCVAEGLSLVWSLAVGDDQVSVGASPLRLSSGSHHVAVEVFDQVRGQWKGARQGLGPRLVDPRVVRLVGPAVDGQLELLPIDVAYLDAEELASTDPELQEQVHRQRVALGRPWVVSEGVVGMVRPEHVQKTVALLVRERPIQ